MKNNENKEVKQPEPIFNSNEMFDYVNLIHTILDYYVEINENTEDSEEWKKGTQYDKKSIPKEVDEAVKRTFIGQLKKFE